MRAWNRAKLLWGYLRRSRAPKGLPVEYIVETTAKCNLYCPMCPRETHKQPKEDMTDEIFNRLVEESGKTAEHMMLIGLGEPFMDRKIFDRIEYCERHKISTLLSTNGTFLDDKLAARLLESPLEHITLSFDGATKRSYEHYRKGAKFEKMRPTFSSRWPGALRTAAPGRAITCGAGQYMSSTTATSTRAAKPTCWMGLPSGISRSDRSRTSGTPQTCRSFE